MSKIKISTFPEPCVLQNGIEASCRRIYNKIEVVISKLDLPPEFHNLEINNYIITGYCREDMLP